MSSILDEFNALLEVLGNDEDEEQDHGSSFGPCVFCDKNSTMKIAHDGEAGCDFLVCSSCGSHVMENVQAIVELRKAIAEAVEERDARNAEEAQIMSVIAAFLDADFICQFCHHEVHFEAIVLKELESADS